MTLIPLDSQSFSDEDFRFRLGTVPGSTEEFFAWSPDAEAVLAERQHWLTTDPMRYAALLPEQATIAEELIESVISWPMLRDASEKICSPNTSLLQRLLLLSQHWEPDFVLLAPRQQSSEQNTASNRNEPVFTVAGGCVCFPSAWRLTDKLGLSVEQVHHVVPQLNAVLGSQIDRLLARLRPGKCIIRSNWGVCSVSELNQHPERNLPPVQLPVQLDQAWLRREDQCLFALPRTGGIVFGIRVTHTSWSDLRDNRSAASSVARSLRTMPHEMLDYKRLVEVREQLARLLDD
jgi:hypothetical protein